jgi:hypothetical protein
MDAPTAEVLRSVLERESRSILMYVGDTAPWGPGREAEAGARLLALVRAEAGALAAIGRLLVRHHHPWATHRSYPASFTSINFVAPEHLAGRLAAYERQSLARLESDLAGLTDPEARAALQRLAEVKRQNLAALQEMAAPRPVPAGV